MAPIFDPLSTMIMIMYFPLVHSAEGRLAVQEQKTEVHQTGSNQIPATIPYALNNMQYSLIY